MEETSGSPLWIDDVTCTELGPGHYLTPKANDVCTPCDSAWIITPYFSSDVWINVVHQQATPFPSLVLLPPYHESRVVACHKPIRVFAFPAYRLGFCAMLLQPWHVYPTEQQHLLTELLGEISQDIFLGDTASQHYIANALASLASPSASNVMAANHQPDIAQRICFLMWKCLSDSQLRPNDIADKLEISRAQLYRVMSAYGGFKYCLNILRVEAAARRLRDPDEDQNSIKAILFGCGFSSSEQFQRLFKQHFGISARDFRHGKKVLHAWHWQTF